MLTRVGVIKKSYVKYFLFEKPTERYIYRLNLEARKKSIFYISQDKFFLEKYDIDVNSSKIENKKVNVIVFLMIENRQNENFF
jgi:hypothetical protein